MTGSDNVCYVVQNKRLSDYDSGIISTDLQSACAGEHSVSVGETQSSSRVCATCAKPLTRRWQKRACSPRCAGKLTPVRPQAGEANGNYRGGVSANRSRYSLAFKAARPEAVVAQRAVATALRRGVLVRPAACGRCLRACRPDAHHPDYRYPLSVEWVCRKCHCGLNSPRKDRVSTRHARKTSRPRGRREGQLA